MNIKQKIDKLFKKISIQKADFFSRVRQEFLFKIQEYNASVPRPVINTETGEIQARGQVAGRLNNIEQTLKFWSVMFFKQADNVDDKGVLRITRTYIAKAIHRTPPTADLLLKNLIDGGFIKSKSKAVKDFGNGHVNCLYLVFEDWVTNLFKLMKNKVAPLKRKLSEFFNLKSKAERQEKKEKSRKQERGEGETWKNHVDKLLFTANGELRKKSKNPFDSLE